MRVSLVTAPTYEPLTTAEAKLHLRVDVSDDDALIASLITAARQYVENFTRRLLMPQTIDVGYDAFPCEEWFVPRCPVQSVTSISYYDGTGSVQTWGSSNYVTDIPVGPYGQLPRIAPASGVSYPATQDRVNAVTVRLVCGYGTGAQNEATQQAAVPAGIKAAMKLLIGHWYAHRESVAVGTIATPLPQAVETLLWPFKVFV
jgi:uncharacterized phiE125 gp8 family phage protein